MGALRLVYISPSRTPSRTANSVYAVRLCAALASLGHEVTLLVCRPTCAAKKLRAELERYYGVDLRGVRLRSVWSPFHRGEGLAIALLALVSLLGDRLRDASPVAIMSRNLVASWLLSLVPRVHHLVELHDLERGVRARLQRHLLKSSRVKAVVLSKALMALLDEAHGVAPGRVRVFRGVPPPEVVPVDSDDRVTRREIEFGAGPEARALWVAYFGHLYPGRGIDLIEALAPRHPTAPFLIFGGNDREIRELRHRSLAPNLHVMGHVPPARAVCLMPLMDVLLMPYGHRVSLERRGTDTSRWMFPQKLAEYLAAGVPIVSADLPVLREVLEDGRNCLMATPDNIDSWSVCLARLSESSALRARLGHGAHETYRLDLARPARTRAVLEFAFG